MEANAKHKRYEVREWREDVEPAWWARVYVGGNLQAAEMVCRNACFPHGLCITLEPTLYIFAGGTESGVVAGLIQYPPFSEESSILRQKAIELGKAIAEACCQWSFTVVTPSECIYYSRRKK